jgi:hypothetical protein
MYVISNARADLELSILASRRIGANEYSLIPTEDLTLLISTDQDAITTKLH